jgi:predicted nucleotidyltransferase
MLSIIPKPASGSIAIFHSGRDFGSRTYSILARQPHPLLFVTLSGSHLYGFPSADSDFDLRGVHVVPAENVLGLSQFVQTIEEKTEEDGYEDELVTHDARKYFNLLLKNNGYVLEQIFSPLVIFDSGHLDELRTIAQRCITSNHSLHYKGFGSKEWAQFVKKPTKHVKRILYVFRVFMTGIHLMRTGEVEANIVKLNETFKFSYIPELIQQKIEGYEHDELAAGHGLDFYTKEYVKLEHMLEEAAANSDLPQEPCGRQELNDLLIRARLKKVWKKPDSRPN